MEIAILLALILLNGVFATAEIALISARRTRLQKMLEAGDKGARAAVLLGENPTRFLSTIQIGITSIGILNGIVGEAALAGPFAQWMVHHGLDPTLAGWSATVLVVVVLTYVTIVLGELVPKRLGQVNPEPIARLVARPMLALAMLTRPFVHLLSSSTDLILRTLGVPAHAASAVTEEDIHALLEEGSDSGAIELHEHQMVRNVFRLDDRQIASLMVPRSDIVFLDVNEPIADNLKRIEASHHSRFPVCRGDVSEVLGVISAKQVLVQTIRGVSLSLTDNLEPAVFVPESLTGMQLLEQFKSSSAQIAFVIDEYGEILGIVTLQDMVEAITGEFKPRSVEEAWAIQREDGSWLLDGIIPIPELKDRLLLKEVPEEDKGRYNTLSGMVMLLLGRLPKTGDWVDWADWRFEIVDMDDKRIDKVLAAPIKTGQPEPPATTQPA